MWVTAKECLGLPGLPSVECNIRLKLNKIKAEMNLRRKRQGTKATEYHIECLPPVARDELLRRTASRVLAEAGGVAVPQQVKVNRSLARHKQQVSVMIECPQVITDTVNALTSKQKAIADARCLLAVEVHRLRECAGLTRIAAVQYIVDGSRHGTLPDVVMRACEVANARRGSRQGIGRSALQDWYSSWLTVQGDSTKILALLAPGHHKEVPWQQTPWLESFFAFYRIWKRPTVSEAYEDFSEWWMQRYADNEAMLASLPRLHVVQYVLRKVPELVRERFRCTGSAWRSLNPFKRRDWTGLGVNDVWVGDGHCMKMQAFNPDTGNVFRPELTYILDAGQRFVVGWSLSLSENCMAVADAMRHAVSAHGAPLAYYSDNGPGQKNKTLDADITGILPRLGIEHYTGIPGNPQARGIIERPNRILPHDVSRHFGSFNHKCADEETVRLNDAITKAMVDVMAKGGELNQRQAKRSGEIPTWKQLLQAMEIGVERYNRRSHSALPRGEDGKHYSPKQYRNKLLAEQEKTDRRIEFYSPDELHEMFRPEIIRTSSRGEVRLFNNIYFSKDLLNYPDTGVRVSYDIHDADSVIIRRMDGSYICDAIWNGNRVDAFPKAEIQRLAEKRVAGRIGNAERRADDARRELTPAIEDKWQVLDGLTSGFIEAVPEPVIDEDEPDFVFQYDRDKYREQKMKKQANER